MAIEDGFLSVVAVEWDANADGRSAGPEGEVDPAWTPAPGLEAVACRICDDRSQRNPGSEFTEDTTNATILFGAQSGVPNNQILRFQYVETDTGSVSYYYSNGKVTNPGKMGAYLRVRCRQGAIP